MRKISGPQIIVFLSLLLVAGVFSISATRLLLGGLPLGDFRGIVLALAGLIFFYSFSILEYRLLLRAFPLQPGDISLASRQEFIYHVYLLFYLLLFYPVTRSGAIPVPIMRLVYQALGARLGQNTFSSGIIMDPPFVEIGDNSLIGQYALLIPHAIENEKLSHHPIRIGSNVTIGAHAVVMAGVEIGNNALVAVGAVVSKGTKIGEGEIWGGIPAKKIDSYRNHTIA